MPDLATCWSSSSSSSPWPSIARVGPRPVWVRLLWIVPRSLTRLVCKLETEGSKGRALPPGYAQISLLHRMHLHLTSPILHHHLLCTLRDPPACLSFLRPKKTIQSQPPRPCFLFLQDPPFFLFYFFFCNSQRKTKSIYSKSLAPSTPVRNRLLHFSRNRGTCWQVPYGLTKASGGEFKVDVGEQTDSEVKKQKKKQS
jgi:hypothetical protein